MPKINLFKKISLIFLSSLLFLNSMAMPFAVAAQNDKNLNGVNSGTGTGSSSSSDSPSTWYNQGFTDWYAKVYGDESPPSEIFGERYTAAQVQWILYSLFSFPLNVVGGRLSKIISCVISSPGISFSKLACAADAVTVVDEAFQIMLGADPSNLQGNSSINNLNFISAIHNDYQNRPISGIKYLNTSISKFVSVPLANAQGFGFGAVDGLQQYWNGFRDVAYALSVLVVIIFAFMIMFRVKLSPQLVISVQSALPKIVGALVLATFSYAIAGFVIDLSYVVGGLLASLMNLAGFSNTFEEAFKVIMPIEGTTALGGFYILVWMLGYTIAFLLAAVIALYSTVFGASVYGFLAGLIMILMTIWVFVLMVWYTLKVPWVLLKNLISLFLSIVIAPIQIMVGALVPSIGFSMWIRKIIAETLVFPLTGLFMFLAAATLNASFVASFGQMGQGLTSIFGGINGTSLWAPPILGSSADMAGILWLAVSFTFITMIPKAVDIMKMLVMGAKFDFGSAIGEAAQPVGMYGKYAASQMGKGTEGSLPWPLNQIPQAEYWWRTSKGKVRGVARGVAEQVNNLGRH